MNETELQWYDNVDFIPDAIWWVRLTNGEVHEARLSTVIGKR